MKVPIEDWAGNRINRYIYRNGQAFRLVENPSTGMNNSDCLKTDWYLCDIDESGNTSNCVYMYSEWIGACNQGLEPPGEGGGYEEYIEIEKRKQVQWEVYHGQGWWITGFDVLKGKSGVFTNVIPSGSYIGGTSPYIWRQDSHTTGWSGSIADANVYGVLITTATGSVAGSIEGSKIWFYSDVF